MEEAHKVLTERVKNISSVILYLGAMNASRISNNTSSSVLSERVHRISEKINEIHVRKIYHNLEKVFLL